MNHKKFFYLLVALIGVSLVLGASDVLGKESNSFERSFDVKKGGLLELSVDMGDVKISTTTKNTVTVVVTGIPEDDPDLEIELTGNTVSIHYDVDGWGRHHRNVRFHATVPTEFDVDLETSGGDIEVLDDLKGTIVASTAGGDIEVENISGQAELRTAGGDIVSGNVSGDADFKTAGGDIEVGEVGGELEAHTSGGDIIVRSVKKTLDAQTSGGDIEVGDIGGRADVSTAGGDIELGNVSGSVRARTAGGDIELNKADGEVEVQTAGGDIEVRDVTGQLEAETAGGDVYAELAPAGTEGRTSISTAGGDIELYVPSNAKANITARIRLRGHWHDDDDDWDDDDWSEYDIESDFESTDYERGKREVRGEYVLNGGGQRITLETTNGSIHIKKMR